jgi:hypothetical protein
MTCNRAKNDVLANDCRVERCTSKASFEHRNRFVRLPPQDEDTCQLIVRPGVAWSEAECCARKGLASIKLPELNCVHG